MSEAKGAPLAWWRLALLEVALVIATSGTLNATTDDWTLIVWLVAALIQAALVVEAIRLWRARPKVNS
jgi:hypothetical protein